MKTIVPTPEDVLFFKTERRCCKNPSLAFVKDSGGYVQVQCSNCKATGKAALTTMRARAYWSQKVENFTPYLDELNVPLQKGWEQEEEPQKEPKIEADEIAVKAALQLMDLIGREDTAKFIANLNKAVDSLVDNNAILRNAYQIDRERLNE